MTELKIQAVTANQAVADLPEQKRRKLPTLILEGSGNNLRVDITGDFSQVSAGAGNRHVSEGLIAQLASLGSHGRRWDADASNFALGFVDAMQPKDAAETALLVQMAATHQAAMMLARRLNHVETIPQQDAAERALNKLLRSYAAQLEALKRYRSKGQQVVRVEHVTVNAGGQAIVGTVST